MVEEANNPQGANLPVANPQGANTQEMQVKKDAQVVQEGPCTKHKRCRKLDRCIFDKEAFLKKMREGFLKWKAAGSKVVTISRETKDMIIDLYVRGMRVYEIAKILNLDWNIVSRTIQRYIKALKLKLAYIQRNPYDEVAFLLLFFEDVARSAMTQFAAQKDGAVKEKFLNTSMKAMLCKIKLLIDAGILSAEKFGGMLKEAEVIDQEKKELTSETKEKLRQLLQKMKEGVINAVKNGE